MQGVTVAQQIGQQMQSVKIQAFIGGLSLAEDKVRAKTCQVKQPSDWSRLNTNL